MMRAVTQVSRQHVAATAFVFLAGSVLPTSTARGQQAALTGGLSLFVLPGRPSARMTVDYQYMFDAQTTSIVPTAFNAGVFPSTGPQSTLRAQFVASF